MKHRKTPTIKAPVVYAPELLQGNHIYLAATDNSRVYVDGLFRRMPFHTRLYLLLHEEGHIVSQHYHERRLDRELEADAYAVRKMGRLPVYLSMLHLVRVFAGIDWTVSAEFLVRLADLGCPGARKMYVTAPNGLRFDVDAIRRYL